MASNGTDSSQIISSPYNYIPTEWVCATFVSLYGLSTLFHFCQSIKFKTWWMLPTAVFAGVAEILGWSARLWSSMSPSLLIPYEIQLTCTILAPTPLVAANFIILGRIIQRLGPRYSRLSPKWYAILFCSFDVCCLVVQAVGGATAASAVSNGNDPDQGGNIMLGGIIAQMVAISVYVAMAGEFFLRYFADNPVRITPKANLVEPNELPAVIDTKLKWMIIALVFDTTCIFIRAVYRTIELADGWSGRIISTQVYFNVLDGAMITLAIYSLNFAHPGWLLTKSSTPAFNHRASDASGNTVVNVGDVNEGEDITLKPLSLSV